MSLFSKKHGKHSDNDFFTVTANDEAPLDTPTPLGEEKAPSQNLAAHALTADEINRQEEQSENKLNNESPLDALKKRMLHIDDTPSQEAHENKTESKEDAKKDNGSLFDKCLPYVTDENGKIVEDDSHNYSLEKFSDTAASENELLDMLYKKYNISFTEVRDLSDKNASHEAEPQESESTDETIKPAEKEEHIEQSDLKDVQTNIPMISDIDSESSVFEDITTDSISHTGTIRFTPIHSDTDRDIMSVSSNTRPIDLTGELTQLPENEEMLREEQIEISKNEFDEYTPKEEYISPVQSKGLVIKYAHKNRNRFFAMLGTIVVSLILLIFKITSVSEILITNFTAFAVVSLVLFAALILINADMFTKLPKLFSRKASADSLCSVASVSCFVYTCISFANKITPLDTILLAALILCFRSIGAFMNSAYMLSNLRQLNTPMKKRAVTLIDDTAVTYAMAKDAIEGDALIAAPRYTENISDYMKHSTFGAFMQGKLPVIAVTALIAAFISGVIIAAYTGRPIHGFYAAASVLMFAGMPVIYLLENLPLYSAAKKLRRSGAMIAGKTGAALCEMANAVVLNSEDLFPSGTITLHDIKVLSENNIDDTLLRAASLAEAIGSPLANIFKKINDSNTGAALPTSDTIKYEDRMGISGWVDNQLLFIGNRTLLEAHGIPVPSIETDRKILKNGYFPVYVASNSSVYALLIVQYSVNPHVAHELKKLTGLGVTILVNNTDQNLTEEMICDYLGLYSDSVKIMSAAGTHLYKTAIRPQQAVSAPAMYKGNPIALASIINCASKIKKSNILLTVIYAIAAVLGAVLFIYAPFSGSGTLLSSSFVLLYNTIATIVSYLLYLIFKP